MAEKPPSISSQSAQTKPWQAAVLTLFPDMFPGVLGQSLAGKALQSSIWSLDVTDIRAHGVGVHHKVDDPPFGGGPGMVMRPDVMAAAIDSAAQTMPAGTRRIYLSPRGKQLDQALVRELSTGSGVMLVCGRYEGLDQRIIDQSGLMEISIGDYILSGGEMAAQILIDAVVRLLPGVMGNPDAHHQDSFEDGLLEHPLYTHPREWSGVTVPDILLSGDHGRIATWRHEQAKQITRDRRDDLWQKWLLSQPSSDDGGKNSNKKPLK